MTQEEKTQLARAQGILEFASSWAEIQRKVTCRLLEEKNGIYDRGLAAGAGDVAQDAISSIERAIAMIEPLWRGEDHGPE